MDIVLEETYGNEGFELETRNVRNIKRVTHVIRTELGGTKNWNHCTCTDCITKSTKGLRNFVPIVI